MGNGNSTYKRPLFGFRCIIAGGGTGGHLFPGIAIAKEIQSRFEDSDVLFVVGRKKMESEILSRYGYRTKSIHIEGLKGRGWKNGIAVFFNMPKSLLQAASIIKEFRPFLVLGMGGYSAGPICLMARLKGIPTAIHEQNSFPGLTNRLLSRFVDRVFISFEESSAHFKARSMILTGNPVRDELFLQTNNEKENHKGFVVLVIGGSQGARAINTAFVEAVTYLKSRGKYLEIIHQAGKTDYEHLVEEYRSNGLEGAVTPFIEDMATAYHRADLVVSRAGATTIFELAALGKPSVLIPYPYAANQHQKTNALSLVRAGGAHMIPQSELTGKSLAQVLMKYMDNRQALRAMGQRARNMGNRDAARTIVDQLVELSVTGS
ncbi:MAG TPA: undecaprenyldiphospho-muramoylpentapeptide beta-N-acetylglucosaminyltransferase [Desulfobacteraceae bacterium]|nr:undecaprenyldiphospho-muramoylpentapeptide beta-N-acetylglucosaminyltransferase [Desulfobacteraceae bacterium]